MYYAHRTDDDNTDNWQRLEDHLREVAEIAREFANVFGAGEWGYYAGILHDLGKFSEKYQRRLRGSQEQVDHATAGAQYIYYRWNKSSSSLLLAYAVAGHHTGLPDFGSGAGDDSCLFRRLYKEIEPYEEAAQRTMPDLKLDMLQYPFQKARRRGLHLSLFARMIFSCLVDADSLNAERFADPDKAMRREHTVSIRSLLERYEAYMAEKFSESRSPLDPLRRELLQICMAGADQERGFFTMTMPTGSGKTLASLGFALRHAVRHNMQRIIFVVPYTSIIEQNAAVYRKVLGAEHVLEHHSNVQHSPSKQDARNEDIVSLSQKLRLAEENWDFPVIVTTNVQFFESLFANRRSSCRKLHNIANSVIVIDEAQMMNGAFYRPCLYALEELTRIYGSSIVLSTATQPIVEELFKMDPPNVCKLIEDKASKDYFDRFQRVRVQSLGMTDYPSILASLSEDSQALYIVNTRRAAREIYEQAVAKAGPKAVFHLSARMCPMHRKRQLCIIRQRLKSQLPCILVSTQLIECGVDVDFPIVYRELAGLDSIAQAAGRCNREFKLKKGIVYIFETEITPQKGWFGLTANIARGILQKYSDDPLSLTAVREYFNTLFSVQTAGSSSGDQDKLDQHGILSMLEERGQQLAFPFRTVAETFQLIDSPTRAVLIPYNKKAAAEIESLRHAVRISGLMRKLQPYVVQLYPDEFNAFLHAGEIKEVREGVFVLANPERWYDDAIGVKPWSEKFHREELYII